jgi:ELWxxDGT repeat protein
VTLSAGFTTELFTTDGTVPGTGPLVPGSGLTLASGLGITSNESQAYFFAHADAPGSPVNIWRSDGSPAGTAMFVELAQPTLAAEIAVQNGRVYFPAGGFTDSGGQELWVSDGTPAGTERLADIFPGPAGSMPGSLRASRGMIYFTANDGVAGGEPWVTDGTTGGTVPLGDFNRFDQSAGSDPRPLLQFNGGLLFSADDGINGRELWFTDGTTGNAAWWLTSFGDGSSNRGMVSLGGIAVSG